MNLHYNGATSCLFVNGIEIHKFKAKDSETAKPLPLGNISKDFSVDNMKKTGLNGYAYDFSVDYDATAIDEIPDIHKYLMKTNGIVEKKCLNLLKVFIAAMTFFSFNILSVISLECVSMNDQECKARLKIIDVNNNEPVFYPFSTQVNKCSESCNNINDPYAKLCVPGIVKSINVKVFNLLRRINETKHIVWHETCKCVCRLSAAVCNC